MKNISGDKTANRLINESSPYLLQHAYNPVDWYPWGEEALKKAEKEDKLLIISVGYAACHWCHVMEHESFEDSIVAQMMNEHFVSIKVDREERPDVDDVYMTAANLINGRGGWPLNAIALPNGKPVFAGTYYPKDQWMNILQQIVNLKKDNPQRLIESSEKITEGINSTAVVEVNTDDLNFEASDIKAHVQSGLTLFDLEYGGRTGAPKFPMPNTYEYLMKYYWYTKDDRAMDIVNLSLEKMANGGIYDQLGGGFARYSVDKFWLVPHFEKMLYDNGQLVSIYAQAFQITKDPLYEHVVRHTIDFVERELQSPNGGFYSSLDADSEGEEGKFYVWQASEIDSLLEEDEAKYFKDYYDVSEKGNWEHTNILNKYKSIADLSKKYKLDENSISDKIKSAEEKLMSERSKRVRPGLDDKILTSWNALMIKGYIDAYNALGDERFLSKAQSSLQFILDNQMDASGRLNRNYKDGKSSINAFLDDYAITINALLKMYEASFDIKWLEKAELLTEYVIEHFFNEESKMFDYTSDEDTPLIAKKAEFEDNVIPSSNSEMARALFKLGTLKYNNDYIDMSEQMLKNMINQISSSQYISFYSNWLQLLLDHTSAPYEVAIVGQDALKKRKELAKNYTANAIFLGSTSEENLDLLKGKSIEDATMIFVCQNKTCKLPVEDIDSAYKLMEFTMD